MIGGLYELNFYHLLVGLFLGLLSCTVHDEQKTPSYLTHAADELIHSNHPYNSSKRTNYYQHQQLADPDRRHDHQLSEAVAYLRAGNTSEAIQQLEDLSQLIDTTTVLLSNQRLDNFKIHLIRYQALAYLRQGEQENCILDHHHHSCIVPIATKAIHQLPSGSRGSIDYFLELLKRNPQDYESQYLLNLAYMTLGKYPNEVPESQLIMSPLFKKPNQRWVQDVAVAKNLDEKGLAGGVVAEDFNQDGHIDLMISSWDMQTHLQLFLNDGGGNWKEVSFEASLSTVPGGLNLVPTDFNNDGMVDILVLRGGWLGLYGNLPNSLLKNEGANEDGIPQFKDVTQQVGMVSQLPTQTAVWADFNLDGWLDVFIGNESAVSGFNNSSELYINQKGGTFREVALAAEVSFASQNMRDQRIIKGVAAADYNHDKLPDLFVSTRDGNNYLFKNQGVDSAGVPVFEDVTTDSGLDAYDKTFTTWFWDYNNDGWEDLLVSGFHSDAQYEGKSIADDFAREQLGLPHVATAGLLYKNQGDGTFTDVSKEAGLDKILYMMGGNFGDIDNDGWLDFYCGNGDPDLRSVIPNRMFRFNGERFAEITNQGFGHIQKGHGTAFADFDEDGDQDIYMVVGGFYEGDVYQNILLDNQGMLENHYIQVRLKGSRSNTLGIGARLEAVLKADNEGHRRIFRTVGSGGSFGASPFTQHIGLGDIEMVDTLYVHWPNSTSPQILTQLVADRLYVIEEDSLSSEAVSSARFAENPRNWK